jgi:uncharacterized membrane protein
MNRHQTHPPAGRSERSRTIHALEENVEAIKEWEETLRLGRSTTEKFSDWITAGAASGPVVLIHVVWFALWIAINLGRVPAIPVFDPFPFNLLTMTVSLEAIFLALFVLASQNQLSKQSDKRAALDLQIDLLAEREMTAALLLLTDIAAHLKVEDTVTREQIKDLSRKTDIQKLTVELEQTERPGSSRER